MYRMLVIGVVSGFMLFSFAIYVNGQEKIRIVQDIYLPKDAPVQIIGRELEGRKLDVENSGPANSDWIKHLTFEVKNVSEKNVSFIEIMLMVPQQEQMPGPAAYLVTFGSRDGTDVNGLVRPEEVRKIKVRDSDFLTWEKRLKNWGVGDFDRVLLQLRAIYFDDGTGWSTGLPLVQDPGNPKRWFHVDKPMPDFKPSTRSCGDVLSPVRLDAGFFFSREAPKHKGSVDGGYQTETLVNARAVQIQKTPQHVTSFLMIHFI